MFSDWISAKSRSAWKTAPFLSRPSPYCPVVTPITRRSGRTASCTTISPRFASSCSTPTIFWRIAGVIWSAHWSTSIRSRVTATNTVSTGRWLTRAFINSGRDVAFSTIACGSNTTNSWKSSRNGALWTITTTWPSPITCFCRIESMKRSTILNR